MILENKVLETIKKYNLIEENDKLVLGVSGGPDSITMLTILNRLKEKLNFEMVVAHINHGIRENAKIDEAYVEKTCKSLGIECFILQAKVKELATSQKRGLEETGRKVRYDFFDEVLKKVNANKIAIAHNKNDNSETMIMNVLRGSGINGLRGIEAKQGKYIRPLIETQRKEIEEFCEEEKLEPRIDESNFENEFTRNKIRNIVIPYIKQEFNPNIINTLERLAIISREQDDYINNQAKIAYNKIVVEEINLPKQNVYNESKEVKIILDLKKFNLLDTAIQKKVILISIQNIFGTIKGIEMIHLEDIVKLCNNNIGNKYLTPNKNLKIVIKNKQIHINLVK
jgi:tRNA(Ile)-lysidine synthase